MSRPSRGRGRGFGGRGRGSGDRGGGPRRDTSKLFIGNMPDTVRRSDLKELFEKFGDVVECDIVKDYAFVHYKSVEEAKAAVNSLHDKDFQGSKIRVELSHSHVRTKPGMGDKDECFRCGRTGHWSKDCPKAPPGRRDNGASGSRSRRDDDYGRDPYSRDPHAREGYNTRDPYSRGLFAERDPYARDPYARDPYLRERLPAADRYRASAALRYDPYARRAPAEPPVARDVYKDPYARPPPDYYRKSTVERDPYADPYARARLPPR